MANLRAIKDRIKSIINTQKITKAMKMVAAAKVRKAENAVRLSRPFTDELHEIFTTVYNKVRCCDCGKIKAASAIDNYPALLEEREIKTVGIAVVSSNKGLAGAYSSNLVRFTLNRIRQAKANGQEVKLYLAGVKALAPLKSAKRHLHFEIAGVFAEMMNDVSATSALDLANELADDYIEKKIDSIEIITTRYKNMMTYKVEDWTLLPAICGEGGVKKFKEEDDTAQKELMPEALIEFEPSAESVLSTIVPMYMTNIIYQALLEASASELASRVSAMSTATENAQDMIENLTIIYNKKRQEKITDEIIEIVSGANALQ